MSEYTRPYAVPQDPAGRQGQQARQPQEPPDFLMMAHGQLVRAHKLAERLEARVNDAPEGADVSGLVTQLVDWRLKIASGYTALADIQYSIPGDDGDGDEPGDDEDEDDGTYDPRRRR